ncbi:MAG: DEAD/DEAH box helicase [Cyanobacteria bacterium]|nr:DEAD/DEAH box helicase [Cyanobacteriota bacterium]MDA0866487.1 DEAD/DEAH box helicase [Cyanobacteriota bacterium]
MIFDDLGLSTDLLRAVNDQGYSEPTPVQQQAIPLILQGKDLMATAQTGTGKTAGFVLPMLQRLSEGRTKGRRPVRALVLTPTRELAAQVSDSVSTYGKYMLLRQAAVFGGVRIQPQIQKLRRGVDVLVATPGRLLDHVSQQTVDLSAVEMVVLDEADRMLDMGFIHDIHKILALMPDARQTVMFSATFSNQIRRLADEFLNQPAVVEVASRNTAAENVTQLVHPVDQHRKRELLSFIIGDGNWQQVLVFTRTKHGADRLARQLAQDGLRTTAIHGNKSQAARTRALSDFKRGSVRVLVATDVAARGLDIDTLPHVVNFELPNVPEDYVHRIGRTGRAGNEGDAISLVSADEYYMLKNIERLLNRDITKAVVPGYEPETPMPTRSSRPRRSGGRRGGNGGGSYGGGGGSGQGRFKGNRSNSAPPTRRSASRSEGTDGRRPASAGSARPQKRSQTV